MSIIPTRVFSRNSLRKRTPMGSRTQQNVSSLFCSSARTLINLYLVNPIRKVIASISILQQQLTPSKMKQTVIVAFVLVFLLCQVAFSQAVEVNNKRGNGKGNAKGNKKNPIPPSIRKCQNVKCEAGFFCLNGRCKKVDYACANMKCEKGFRCNKGQCVEQAHEPKQQVCKPLGYEREKLHCGPEQQKRCQANSGITGVCGFVGNGKFQDFQSECAICQPKPLAKFFFNGTCKSAPRVCTAAEECLNGVCTAIFNESVFENYRTCNKNQDCKVHERCAGHKCVDKRDMFNYLQSKAEADQMIVTA